MFRCIPWHWGRGGGLVDTAADSGPSDLSSIPLDEKKENKQKRGQGWPIFKKMYSLVFIFGASELNQKVPKQLFCC